MNSSAWQSAQRSKFEAWLTNGVLLRNKGSYLVLPVEEAKSKLSAAASSRDWELVKEISSQLQARPVLSPEKVVSKSFRLPFLSFTKLAYASLQRNSPASRLLRQSLLTEAAPAIPDIGKLPSDKNEALRAAIRKTAELQEADTSSYSRNEYRLPAVLYSEKHTEISEMLWDELMSQVPEETAEKLALIKSSFVDTWTDFPRDWGQLDFVIRKDEKDNSVQLQFEADGLSFLLDEEELDQIGAEVAELDKAIFPFMVQGSSVLDEDCTIGIDIITWKVSVRQGRVYLDDFPLDSQRVQKLRNSILSPDQAKVSILEKELKAAVSAGEFATVTKISDELTRINRRSRLHSLAHDKLAELLEGKPAVVSFTASEPLFGLWSLRDQTIESLIDKMGTDH